MEEISKEAVPAQSNCEGSVTSCKVTSYVTPVAEDSICAKEASEENSNLETQDLFEKVAELQEIPVKGKKCLRLLSTDRSVLLVRLSEGHYYCMDQACYHHGGPLGLGDIEDLDGKPVIVCPWHSYKLALETGEGLYLSTTFAQRDGGVKVVSQILRSKGVKQRTHPVEVREDGIYVADSSKLSDSPDRIESDTYAYTEMRISKSPAKNIHSSYRMF